MRIQFNLRPWKKYYVLTGRADACLDPFCERICNVRYNLNVGDGEGQRLDVSAGHGRGEHAHQHQRKKPGHDHGAMQASLGRRASILIS